MSFISGLCANNNKIQKLLAPAMSTLQRVRCVRCAIGISLCRWAWMRNTKLYSAALMSLLICSARSLNETKLTLALNLNKTGDHTTAIHSSLSSGAASSRLDLIASMTLSSHTHTHPHAHTLNARFSQRTLLIYPSYNSGERFGVYSRLCANGKLIRRCLPKNPPPGGGAAPTDTYIAPPKWEMADA